jgi:hypothetical protein
MAKAGQSRTHIGGNHKNSVRMPKKDELIINASWASALGFYVRSRRIYTPFLMCAGSKIIETEILKCKELAINCATTNKRIRS